MTTTFFLVRHAVHGMLDKVLVGRMQGVRLSETGREQADQLGARFAEEAITRVECSPRERARETAEPIARRSSLPLQVSEALDEIDLGRWTGSEFAALAEDPAWDAWNSMRDKVRPPGGESMLELQQRIVGHLRQMGERHKGGKVVIVSHAEVIRAALLYYLQRTLDAFKELEILPASISTLEIEAGTGRVLGINQAAGA